MRSATLLAYLALAKERDGVANLPQHAPHVGIRGGGHGRTDAPPLLGLAQRLLLQYFCVLAALRGAGKA